MASNSEAAKDLIAQLAHFQPVKTWSLLVTIFGDMHRAGTTTLSGSTLKELLEPMGIRPEAIRVALHRLRKDDWIRTERYGRETLYSLSDNALKETQVAYVDVYRSDCKYADGWCLASFADGDIELKTGLMLTKQAWLIPIQHVSQCEQVLISTFDRQTIPEWVLEHVAPEKNIKTAKRLVSFIAAIKQQAEHVSKHEALVLRILVLHHWRRMALRNETWFHIWLNGEGVYAKCHQAMQGILEGAQVQPQSA